MMLQVFSDMILKKKKKKTFNDMALMFILKN